MFGEPVIRLHWGDARERDGFERDCHECFAARLSYHISFGRKGRTRTLKEGLMKGFDVQLRIKHFAEIETSHAG
jgi:hypothetical protein